MLVAWVHFLHFHSNSNLPLQVRKSRSKALQIRTVSRLERETQHPEVHVVHERPLDLPIFKYNRPITQTDYRLHRHF